MSLTYVCVCVHNIMGRVDTGKEFPDSVVKQVTLSLHTFKLIQVLHNFASK